MSLYQIAKQLEYGIADLTIIVRSGLHFKTIETCELSFTYK